MSPLDLTTERWARLLQEARVAAAMPHIDPTDLRTRTDRMREVPTPSTGGVGDGSVKCLCNAFRWACLWFATAGPMERVAGAEALNQLGDRLAPHLSPPPPPEAAAAAMPLPLEAPGEGFAWQRRADIAGGD